jgi:prevent-host-death family protein
MGGIVSAAEANRSFSRLLREVRQGRRYVVTAHGRPVARIVPVDEAAEMDARFREVARRELFRRLRSQPILNTGKWTREELYEE